MSRLASTGVELKRAENIIMLVEEENLWSNGERIDLKTALMLFLERMSLEGSHRRNSRNFIRGGV